jgi:hypothetical protein
MDYLPDAARVLKPGGRIIINGSKSNKFTKINESILESLILRIVEKQIPLLPDFSSLNFHRIDGRDILTNFIFLKAT